MRRQHDIRAAVEELRGRVARPEHRELAALTALLARRGIPARVVIGVRKDAPAGELNAHAWVTSGGVAVSPPGDHAQLADL